MAMDSIVATSPTATALTGYTTLTIAGEDMRYLVPAAGAVGARFPTSGYIERAYLRTNADQVGVAPRARVLLSTQQPQTFPLTMRACRGIDTNNGNDQDTGVLANPNIGIPVDKDQTLSIQADLAGEAAATSVVLLIRRDAPGIKPLASYKRVSRQIGTITVGTLAGNTWSPPTGINFEGVPEPNMLYHLLGGSIIDPARQQQCAVAARFRQTETAVGGMLDSRPTILGSVNPNVATITRFPEVLAFSGSSPPTLEVVDDAAHQQSTTYLVEMLIGEVGPLTPSQMQGQQQKAQAPQQVPWQ